METIFSKIVSGDAEASIVFRDEHVTAFLDVHPINAGHTLVVPNRPAPSLADLDDETGARMFNVARLVAAAIRHSDVPCEGMNLLLADGETAGQEVAHVHLHVIPRLKGDGLTIHVQPDSVKHVDRAHLDQIAENIHHQIEDGA